VIALAVYLDTSCFLKLFFPEPETARVAGLIAAETRVVISTLVRLETLCQLHARVTGGLMSKGMGTNLVRRIDRMLDADPYELVFCPARCRGRHAGVSAKSIHCRTLDRLHLATMQVLGLQRLLTNDDRQAGAARALGFDVSLPR
jgi:predicted nucleic acid-binding protein